MRLTLLGRADEVPDAPNTAIILALGFIQLHAHPLATGELRGPAEPQRARLEETREDMAWVALGGHDKITGTGKSLVVQWLRVSTFTAEGSGSVLGDLASCAEWPKKKKNHWQTSNMVECMREPQAQISASQPGHYHSLAM